MVEYHVKRPLAAPAHPGELMREILDDHVKLSVAAAAKRMGVTRAALNNVLNGSSAVTAGMALMFGRLVGGNPDLYLNMQGNYELWHARQRLGVKLKEIEPVRTAPAS